MEKFVISSDDCLILKAFHNSKTLREAAALLSCDPAGLARRVQYISTQHGFLQKVNNRWQVTPQGLDLVAWTETSIQSQKKILLAKSSLRLATTMWFSEEILIPNLKSLKASLANDMSLALSTPGKGFEMALIDGSIDFAIVCHPPENPEIEHKQAVQEAWTLIAPPSWKKDLRSKGDKAFEYLSTKPFVRHNDMNEDVFFPTLETPLLDSGLTIDNLIGIRSAVSEGFGWSIVPRILVERYFQNDRLVEIDYDLPIRDRKICVWWLRNRIEVRKQSGKIISWVREACSTH